VPIVEAMAALVIMDAVLAQQSRAAAKSLLPPIQQPSGLKTPGTTDGSERTVLDAGNLKGEEMKVDWNGKVGGQGVVYGDE
jgi:chorismate synthase